MPDQQDDPALTRFCVAGLAPNDTSLEVHLRPAQRADFLPFPGS
jgi:hypothetical protein